MEKTLQVLCISPRFAPSNEADTHRLRLLLGHAREAGWIPVVVAIDPDCLSVAQDPWLVQRLPAEIEVHRFPIPLQRWGFSSVFIRAWRPLDREVRRLLSERHFDLVFFSTNEFPLALLALGWKRSFGVPFCMDFQDPWVNDYYRRNPDIVPPGGRFKYGLMSTFHRMMERIVVPEASGYLAVSQAYLDALVMRYGAQVASRPMLVKPFPAEPDELVFFPSSSSGSGPAMWRYVGRGGADMVRSSGAFFQAWEMAVSRGIIRHEDAFFEAIGTSYANDGQPSLTSHAAALGISSRLDESPRRLPYSEALTRIVSSDGLVVFGSDDPAYTASKIYPYLLAGKPLLAIFHEESSVVGLIESCGGGRLVTFSESTSTSELAEKICKAWFLSGAFNRAIPLDMESFDCYLAGSQAHAVKQWFESIIRSEASTLL